MRTNSLIAAMIAVIVAVVAFTAIIVNTPGVDGDALHSLVGALHADEATPLNVVAPYQDEAMTPVFHLVVAPVDDGTEFSLNA
jgi:hypothetical protein